MNPTPVVSILIPSDGRASLRDTLASIGASRNAPDHEIILVGRLPDGMETPIPFVHFIACTGMGTGAMRNMAVSHAKGDLFLFTDSDCIVDPDWMARAARSCTPERPVVAGGIRFPETNPWDCGDNLAIFHATHVSQRAGRAHGHVGTNNLAVRREVFSTLGGFDISLTVGEDGDFLARAAKAGYPAFFDPSFAVRHQSNRETQTQVQAHAAWYASGYVNLLRSGILPHGKIRAESILPRHPRMASVWSGLKATLALARIVLPHPAFWRYRRSFAAAWIFLYARRRAVFRLLAE
ncbi:MAG: glycosyltransferase [Verrucomicrobiota bacterium]|nr:glycosyltransferase [Verrucomicrobiota bacterium]